MLFIKPEIPVDEVLVQLLMRVHNTAEQLRLSYFVGGALARDLLLLHVHGFHIPRPTRDVDIGIAVRGWDDFENVKIRLSEAPEFSLAPGITHRLIFRLIEKSQGIPLDIVPFAGVEEPGATLRWPPDRAVVMNITGFDEALAQAEQVKIAENVAVPVASLPGQTLLKLAAWLDRRAETSRDAVDLAIIFRRYGDAGNMDRLYEDKPTLLESVDFDIERAGATLLGEDVRAIARPQSYRRLSNAFASPALKDAFLTHVSSGISISGDRVDRAKTLVDAFFTGFGTVKSS